MSPSVNRRTYDSSRRREQARQTRLAVIEAARRLFLERGYAATTMSAIADDAGVSVETVYKSVGNKAAVAKTVFDVAIVGDDEELPLVEREFVQRNMAEPDPREKLRQYGEHISRVMPRVGPVLLVVAAAAATDTGAADVWEQTEAERLAGMTMFATHLQQGGHLRDGVSLEEARDVLWLHNSVEVWELLVNRRGWSNRRYGTFVGRQLIAALL